MCYKLKLKKSIAAYQNTNDSSAEADCDSNSNDNWTARSYADILRQTEPRPQRKHRFTRAINTSLVDAPHETMRSVFIDGSAQPYRITSCSTHEQKTDRAGKAAATTALQPQHDNAAQSTDKLLTSQAPAFSRRSVAKKRPHVSLCGVLSCSFRS